MHVIYSRAMVSRGRIAAFSLFAALLILSIACGDDEATSPTATASPVETATAGPSRTSAAASPTEEPFSGGRGAVEATPSVSPPLGGALLRDVRIAEHSTFDRITLEFEGGLPGYRVRYVEAPIIADPSGLEVEIAGTAFLEVRMEPAAGHDPNTGDETYTGPLELKPGLPSLLEAERTGDFEAVLTWVLGVSAKADFRVLTLQDPPRLVMDVGHS